MRVSKRPLAASTLVTVKVGQRRCRSCVIQLPSVFAKYFCSFTTKSDASTKLAPARLPASPTAFSRSAFCATGIASALVTIGVRQARSPCPACGASSTGSACSAALARATASASRVARARPSRVTSLVAANPQVPRASTRTPAPWLSVALTFRIPVSRDWTLSFR